MEFSYLQFGETYLGKSLHLVAFPYRTSGRPEHKLAEKMSKKYVNLQLQIFCLFGEKFYWKDKVTCCRSSVFVSFFGVHVWIFTNVRCLWEVPTFHSDNVFECLQMSDVFEWMVSCAWLSSFPPVAISVPSYQNLFSNLVERILIFHDLPIL